MAKPELGSKHHCEHCGTRFFDLNRSPIACPKCGTVVEGVTRVIPHAAAPDEKDLSTETETEIVSLEEADAEEDKVATVADDEVEIDTSEDTFLEEEEEDDGDVGDLIDSDIGDEEER
ncbi:MAG TPA: TIGR02300 family protein [Methylocella sp.]|nr:TIGR02300 family protein [Methylocella sp.]